MTGWSPAALGRIFISYRREETAYPAGWLFDRLLDHYGDGQVFKDVDSMQLGDDFVDVIARAVGSCDVLLALIGTEWLTITDAAGRRRLDDPTDFVRVEIEAALTRKVRVIPILVGGARMPRAAELPESLAGLVRRQALELSPIRFDFDTGRLLKVLDRTLAEVRAAQEDVTSSNVPAATRPDPVETEPPQAQELLAQERPREQRRRLSTRLWVLAGVGVGVTLILVIVAVVVNSGTPPPTGAVATKSASANEVVFQGDFSSPASGWEAYDAPENARYVNGAYRVFAPPTEDGGGAGSLPKMASRVFPTAPPNIRIKVEGRRLPESDQSMEYGVQCRQNGDRAYTFTISDNYAAISK